MTLFGAIFISLAKHFSLQDQRNSILSAVSTGTMLHCSTGALLAGTAFCNLENINENQPIGIDSERK